MRYVYKKGNVYTNVPLEDFIRLAPKGLILQGEADFILRYYEGEYIYETFSPNTKDRVNGVLRFFDCRYYQNNLAERMKLPDYIKRGPIQYEPSYYNFRCIQAPGTIQFKKE